MSNPFRDQPVADADPAPAAESVFEAEVAEIEEVADPDESYGKFPDPEAPKKKPTEQPTVPTARLAKVVRQRNELRESLAEVEARLAAEAAKAETLERLAAVKQAHYRNDPDLLDWDARFMATFDQMAKTNPALAAAAAAVKAAMNGEETPVSETPEQEGVEEAPASDPVLEKIIARDVTRTVGEVLGEHGVKPHFVKAIANDMLNVLDTADLAELTPEDVVECAKVYCEDNGIPMTEFLTPRKGAAKPETASGRAPARAAAAESAPEGEERVKPKTVEEWEAARNKRFKSLAKDLGF